MKRALSIILALSLALALLPTFAYASETEETMNWDEPIVFDFREPTEIKLTTSDDKTYIRGADIYKGTNWAAISYKSYSGLVDPADKLDSDKKRVRVNTYDSKKYITMTPTDLFVEAEKNTFSFALDVPASGIFDISVGVYNSSSGATTAAVIKNLTKNTDTEIGTVENVSKNSSEADGDKAAGPYDRQFSNGIGVPVAKTTNWDTAAYTYNVDNRITLTITKNAGYMFGAFYFTFTPSKINSAAVAVDTEAEYEIGADIAPTVSLNVEGVGDKVYSDLDMAGIVLGVKESDAGVTVENNVYKATKSGTIEFTPTVTVNGKTHDAAAVTVNVASAEPEEDEALTDAFKVTEAPASTYVESTVTGLTDDSTIEAEKNSNGTFTLTAPETKENSKFLYWAKGMSKNKKIISFDNVISDYMPEENGKNYLIAVYEDDVTDAAEYYNANGQRIATGEEPALPSMAGYGTATGWNKYDDANIYVAEYSNKIQPDNVTVTVNGNEKTVPYGTEITCSANGENFKCWTKSNINGIIEIVSVDEEYKFLAWENCSVEAVYEEHTYNGNTKKIVVDSFKAGNEKGIMAEFIGFGSNVVEMGIMWNNNKIAMTKPGTQFSVVADKNGEYKGYAIVGNAEDGYTLITDGSVIVSDAE